MMLGCYLQCPQCQQTLLPAGCDCPDKQTRELWTAMDPTLQIHPHNSQRSRCHGRHQADYNKIRCSNKSVPLYHLVVLFLPLSIHFSYRTKNEQN